MIILPYKLNVNLIRTGNGDQRNYENTRLTGPRLCGSLPSGHDRNFTTSINAPQCTFFRIATFAKRLAKILFLRILFTLPHIHLKGYVPSRLCSVTTAERHYRLVKWRLPLTFVLIVNSRCGYVNSRCGYSPQQLQYN